MICGILLAGGASQRYGSNKLMVPIKNGVPMAVVAARNLLSAVDRVVVVVRADEDELVEQLLQEELTIVRCETGVQGMSESLKAGIQAATEANGWVIALADMPFIQVETILSISKQLQKGASIVAPYYNGRRGHPVGFGAQFLAELQLLDGDTGACSIIERHQDQMYKINCNDASILIDIDTVADMQRISK